uniref:Uncharacterized protein n=1 Tax=Glossina morsitans morsitans TaxID=37546 RepID=A0A1B0FFI7_GLOMM
MTDNYDDNGDYPNYTEDDDYGKQRKTGVGPGGPNSQLVSSHNGDNSANHGLNVNMATSDNNHLNEKANEYIRDCLSEKARMERKFPIAEKLLDSEIEKVQTTGRIPSREQKYADIYREKPLRVSQKVLAAASGSGGMSATSTAGAQVKNMPLSTASYRSNAQQQQQANNTFNKNNVAPKQKVMSILEKARSAMEETYGRGFETDSVTYDQSHTYDSYNYVSAAGAAAGPPTVHNHNIPPHTTQAPTGIGTGALNNRTPYENTDYSELDYNRRDYYQHSPSYGTSGIQSNQNNALNPNRGHVNR